MLMSCLLNCCIKGSFEKCATTFFFSLQNPTYWYNLLQFPADLNTNVSKTYTTFTPFHTNYNYSGKSSINKDFTIVQG